MNCTNACRGTNFLSFIDGYLDWLQEQAIVEDKHVKGTTITSPNVFVLPYAILMGVAGKTRMTDCDSVQKVETVCASNPVEPSSAILNSFLYEGSVGINSHSICKITIIDVASDARLFTAGHLLGAWRILDQESLQFAIRSARYFQTNHGGRERYASLVQSTGPGHCSAQRSLPEQRRWR